MSLLTQQTTQAPGQYYFSIKSSGGLVEPGYTATSSGFIAQNVQDVGAGSPPCVVIQNNTPTTRWNIGLTDTEAGGNTGSALAFVSYNDAGVPLEIPFTIVRATGDATCKGYLTSFADSVGNSVVRAVSTDDPDNFSSLQALNGGSRMTCRANYGGNYIQLQRGVATASGLGAEVCTSPTGATATAMTYSLDPVATGRALGQVDFAIDPTSKGVNLSIPFVSQQNFTNFVGAGTQTLSVPVNAAIVGKPQIMLHWNHFGIQDDAGNPLVMTCSVQADNAVGAPVAGSTINAYPSGGDQVCAGSVAVIYTGTDYNSGTTSLNFVFTVTSGNFKTGRFALSAMAVS